MGWWRAPALICDSHARPWGAGRARRACLINEARYSLSVCALILLVFHLAAPRTQLPARQWQAGWRDRSLCGLAAEGKQTKVKFVSRILGPAERAARWADGPMID